MRTLFMLDLMPDREKIIIMPLVPVEIQTINSRQDMPLLLEFRTCSWRRVLRNAASCKTVYLCPRWCELEKLCNQESAETSPIGDAISSCNQVNADTVPNFQGWQVEEGLKVTGCSCSKAIYRHTKYLPLKGQNIWSRKRVGGLRAVHTLSLVNTQC